MSDVNRRIVLASRPEGEPTPGNFQLETAPVPSIGPGQVLLRTRWLSLDPYMRGRMSAAKSYATPVEVGDVMEGGTVSEVVASENPDFSTGAFVEPITAWEPPHRLAFSVQSTPPPMDELSFREVTPPHLEGFFVSRRGEFRLEPLPAGIGHGAAAASTASASITSAASRNCGRGPA